MLDKYQHLKILSELHFLTFQPYVVQSQMNEAQRERVHIFNSFFLKQLRSTLQTRRALAMCEPRLPARAPTRARFCPGSLWHSKKEDSCDKILRYNGLKDVDLLKKDFIFIPVRPPRRPSPTLRCARRGRRAIAPRPAPSASPRRRGGVGVSL